MSYDCEYHKTRANLAKYVKSLKAEYEMKVNNNQDLKRTILILQLPTFKGYQQLDINNNADAFRAKYLLMLQLKFVPFIKSINLVYWKTSGSKFNFYTNKNEKGNFIEHAIVETYLESLTDEILRKYNDVINVRGGDASKLFSQVTNSREVKVDQISFAEWKWKAKKPKRAPEASVEVVDGKAAPQMKYVPKNRDRDLKHYLDPRQSPPPKKQETRSLSPRSGTRAMRPQFGFAAASPRQSPKDAESSNQNPTVKKVEDIEPKFTHNQKSPALPVGESSS